MSFFTNWNKSARLNFLDLKAHQMVCSGDITINQYYHMVERNDRIREKLNLWSGHSRREAIRKLPKDNNKEGLL